MKTIARTAPRAAASSTPVTAGTSCGPAKASAPGTPSAARAPTATTSAAKGRRRAVRGQRDPGVLVDAGERPAVQLGVAAPRDLLERHGTGAAEPEGRRDRRGPVEELRPGCQQLEVDMAPGELVQREQGFERGDAAARDEHARSLMRACPRRGHGQTAAGVGTSTCSASSTSRFA